MVVRIVDEVPAPEVVKRAICRNCGVTVEYVPNDVTSKTQRDYGGGCDTVKYVACPKCRNKIHV